MNTTAAKEHCMRMILNHGAVSEERLLSGKGWIFDASEIRHALTWLAGFGLLESTASGQWTYTDEVEADFDRYVAAWGN